ncbi:MAG: LysR family transcriptional regulator [Halioglobus sp.]|nr:LysR family transcriptional regulator [Halioglobus sp.]
MEFSRRLRHFLAIYNSGSLGQAAEEIHITQPALSKSLHQLEDEMGVQLFERTPSGVVPTVYGQALSGHVRIIEAEFRSAEAEIASLRGATKGHLHIGVGPSMAPHLMPQVSLRVSEQKPGITMTIVEGLSSDHIPALRRGDLDLAVGTWPATNDKDLVSENLLTDRVAILASSKHPLCGKRVTLPDLLDYPWILPPHTQRWRNRLDEILLEQGHDLPEPKMTTNSPTLLRSVLMKHNYLSFLPTLCLEDDLKAGLICPLEVEGVDEPIDVMLTYRKRSVVSPVCHAFVEILREVTSKNERYAVRS